jgi:hypothetical protein
MAQGEIVADSHSLGRRRSWRLGEQKNSAADA